MDITVKAFLAKSDGSTEVRRLPLTVGGPKDISGLFNILRGQLATAFPGLKDKPFIVSWRDSDGDYVLMSTDEELLEALSEMDSRQLRVFITETPSEVQSDEAAAMFPARAPRGKPCGPWMRVSEEEAIERSVKDDKGWKTALRDLVPTAHRRWAKDFIRQWRQKNLQNGDVTGSSDGERGQKVTQQEAGVPDVYVTFLEIQVFRLHKSWAQEKAGKCPSDFEEAKKSVPESFQNWSRWYLKTNFGPNRSPRFKLDKSKRVKAECEAKKAEGDKPDSEEDDKKEKGDDKDEREQKKRDRSAAREERKQKRELEREQKAWKKEWKSRRKQIRKSVPKHYRKWSECYIRNWRLEHLSTMEKERYQSDSSTDSSSDGSDDDRKRDRKDRQTVERGGVPEDYSRYLDLFLTQWHANQGDKLSNKEVKEAPAKLKQITDAQVPPAYRKWVTFFAIRVLGRKKKDKRQEEEVTTWRQYYAWMLAFQRKWVAGMASDGASSGEEDAKQKDSKAPKGVIERLQNIIDSDVEYDNELPVPPYRRPPAEFRYWAAPILASWDCETIGQGFDDELTSDHMTEEVDIPPGVLSWMNKTMARSQLKRLRAELRDAQKVGRADGQKKDEKEEKCRDKSKGRDEKDDKRGKDEHSKKLGKGEEKKDKKDRVGDKK